MRPTLTLAVLTASFSSLLVAQTERDLDSHEHGSAAMNIAIEGDSVFLELESPWNNLVGFEHAPGNEEQHALVDDAMALLEQPQQLFSFVGSQCTMAKAEVESSLASESEHDDHDDHDKDEEHADHDDHDKDEEHAGHDDHDDESTHSSVLAMYEFNCSDIGKLSGIDVELLEIWTGFEKLDVQLIGPGGQTAVTLDPATRQLNISEVQ